MIERDLFDFDAPPRAAYEPMSEAQEAIGWESRVLDDLAGGPLVYCWEGFMGSVCERLVAKGFVVAEDAGFMAAPGKIKGYQPSDYPQRRYKLKGTP
jgi:hypothetical protein